MSVAGITLLSPFSDQGACNAETSNLMAKSSLERAHQIAQAEKARGQDTAGWVLLGVGCTAAIVSVVPKKGEHRCHVSAAKAGGVSGWVGLLHRVCVCRQWLLKAAGCPTHVRSAFRGLDGGVKKRSTSIQKTAPWVGNAA